MATPKLDFKVDYDPADQKRLLFTDLTEFDEETTFLSRSWTVTKSDGSSVEVLPEEPADAFAVMELEGDHALVVRLNINKVGNSSGYGKSRNVLASKDLYRGVNEARRLLIASEGKRKRSDVDNLIYYITMADENHEGAKNMISIDVLAAQKHLDFGNGFILKCKDFISWV
ncbi:hypothetical protein [Sphingobacterium mizutaii]|uniref:hypothetical protein n=1 Tax=Sphingobacterium mizutaii TaxID=1010 RepID=UPI0028974071|nr:hypothetical protein [Sphingobacterium mizutaii]